MLGDLGLDLSSFVSMALTQLVHRRGLPFAVTMSDEAYFETEYDLAPGEAARAGRRMRRETAAARREGSLREAGSASDLAQ